MFNNSKKIIKRDVSVKLKEHLARKEISMLVGPRQCGKTTVLRFIEQELKNESAKTLYLNLDIEQDFSYLSSQEKLLQKIQLEFGDSPGVIFIDEVQRKENAGRFLKGIYDLDLPYKFIVSGSGNIELKNKVSESLMGRKRVFKMGPISFKEFVNFKTNYQYENNLDSFFELEKEKANSLLLEYLNFGGYPKVVLSTSLEEKRLEINEIYRSFISYDIIKWLKVEKIDSFEKLIKLCANQIGNLVDYSELGKLSGLSFQTTRNYLWYLANTFIINTVQPFYKNKASEIVKSPTIYFYDLGLRNYLVNYFGALQNLSEEVGFVFENFVYNILSFKEHELNYKVNFWRTKQQVEIDFVLDLGKELIPVEAKFKEYKKPVIERSLRDFIKKYNPKTAYLVNKNLESELLVEKTKVKFIPFWKLEAVFDEFVLG